MNQTKKFILHLKSNGTLCGNNTRFTTNANIIRFGCNECQKCTEPDVTKCKLADTLLNTPKYLNMFNESNYSMTNSVQYDSGEPYAAVVSIDFGECGEASLDTYIQAGIWFANAFNQLKKVK